MSSWKERKMKCPKCKKDKATIENIMFEDVWWIECPCGYKSDNRLSKQEAIERFA